MTDWPVKTLGDVATIATGKIDVNAATENGAYPFFTCSRDVYRIDDAPFEGKAILVAGNGDLNVKYYEGRFNAYQRTYFLFARDENKCYPRYLFWFLENYLDVLRSGASGSTIKYIRLGDLSEASIAVPPLDEQKRIVALLDAATERVTELTACYEQARTHANNMFTSASREAFESNPDWPVKTLGDVCELSTGGTPSTGNKAYYDGGEIKWLRSGDVHQREIYDCDGRITEEGMQNANTRYLPLNSVLIALAGQGKTRGTVAMLRTKATCNQSVVSIMPVDVKTLLPEFVFWNLHMKYDEIRRMTGDDGNDRRGLNMRLIRSMVIPVVPLEEQKKIVARLDVMKSKTSEMVAAYDAKLTAAKNLRQSILESAFEGKL
jgi:type I restriction enzyme S subunit